MTERRTIYDGKPYYCRVCGAGYDEYGACEEVECALETAASSKARMIEHNRLMEHLEAQ